MCASSLVSQALLIAHTCLWQVTAASHSDNTCLVTGDSNTCSKPWLPNCTSSCHGDFVEECDVYGLLGGPPEPGGSITPYEVCVFADHRHQVGVDVVVEDRTNHVTGVSFLFELYSSLSNGDVLRCWVYQFGRDLGLSGTGGMPRFRLLTQLPVGSVGVLHVCQLPLNPDTCCKCVRDAATHRLQCGCRCRAESFTPIHTPTTPGPIQASEWLASPTVTILNHSSLLVTFPQAPPLPHPSGLYHRTFTSYGVELRFYDQGDIGELYGERPNWIFIDPNTSSQLHFPPACHHTDLPLCVGDTYHCHICTVFTNILSGREFIAKVYGNDEDLCSGVCAVNYSQVFAITTPLTPATPHSHHYHLLWLLPAPLVVVIVVVCVRRPGRNPQPPASWQRKRGLLVACDDNITTNTSFLEFQEECDDRLFLNLLVIDGRCAREVAAAPGTNWFQQQCEAVDRILILQNHASVQAEKERWRLNPAVTNSNTIYLHMLDTAQREFEDKIIYCSLDRGFKGLRLREEQEELKKRIHCDVKSAGCLV